MSCGANYPIKICIGKTFRLTLQAPAKQQVSKAITNITQAVPAVITTDEAHGLTDGWLVAVESVVGMKDINAEVIPARMPADYYTARIIDTTSFYIEKGNQLVNSLGFDAYNSGGIIRYWKPVDFYGCTFTMKVFNKKGEVIATNETPAADITITESNGTVEILIADETSAELTATAGNYELFMEDSDGAIFGWLYGPAVVE